MELSHVSGKVSVAAPGGGSAPQVFTQKLGFMSENFSAGTDPQISAATLRRNATPASGGTPVSTSRQAVTPGFAWRTCKSVARKRQGSVYSSAIWLFTCLKESRIPDHRCYFHVELSRRIPQSGIFLNS